MLDYFESSTKPTFRNTEKPSYIKFGSLRDTDDKHDIKRGVLSLSGYASSAAIFGGLTVPIKDGDGSVFQTFSAKYTAID